MLYISLDIYSPIEVCSLSFIIFYHQLNSLGYPSLNVFQTILLFYNHLKLDMSDENSTS